MKSKNTTDGKASGLGLITDGQRLVSVLGKHGGAVRIYDDGYGPLWVHRDSMGISGVVRCQTWEDAYEICEDEFFAEADETVEELQCDYGFKREHVKLIRPKGGGEVQPATRDDYPLGDYQFVRWETVETRDDTPGSFIDNELFQEAFGFRPSGPNSRDVIGHGIYSRDLNGEYLEELTVKLAAELEITVQVEDEE